MDLSASVLDDEANYTQYALLSAVAATATAGVLATDNADPPASGDAVAATNGAADSAQGEAATPLHAGESAEGGPGEEAAGDAHPGKAVGEDGVEEIAAAGAGAAAAGSANAASVFGCLVELVRFLRTHVFCGNDEVLGVFMEGFWPQCTEHAAQAAGAVTDQADELQRTIEVRLDAYPAMGDIAAQ